MVATVGVLHLGDTDNVMDVVARASCNACAQRSAMMVRAAPQENFVAKAMDLIQVVPMGGSAQAMVAPPPESS